ncbi:LysR family transcriptional regulator [Erythrobacter sp. AP23]|uniref:LysR family transcriptional regulator n=1 Tax=Erythrobacter sp. AP23 TaxID=499656 RepID=UPI0018DC2702|nr:LysR family transcriptional regulator [Erythrobacter sp. AP23]
MSKIDHLAVDAALLKTLVILHEEQSVSLAADRLGLTQSALSHRLARLKTLFGANIFVRSGRKIASTPEAEGLVAEARNVLTQIERMVNPQPLMLEELTDQFVIAATDYERHLFLINACKALLTEAPRVKVGLVWEKYDNRQGLRDGMFDIACGPLLGHTDPDIHSEVLLEDRFLCFFDEEHAKRPETVDTYRHARHARVIFSRDDSSFVDNALSVNGFRRDIAIDIPSLSEVPQVIRGTPLIVTAPSRLANSLMNDFARCPVPFALPELSFGMEWHERTNSSPRHLWVRSTIREFARTGSLDGHRSEG